MYKRIFILLSTVLFTIVSLKGQVTVSLQVPPTGVLQKNQLWNMVLVNTGNNSQEVYVGLSLLDATRNRPLLTATSRSFVLDKGARQLSLADISPIQYSYLSPVFDVDRAPNGFLPIGNYKACYTVYKKEKTATTPLTEDCIPVEVQPLEPPLLNAPADTATLQTAYPQFSWLPPAPLNLFGLLSYDLLVVEVLPGQTSGDAIQKNLPVYNAGNITLPFNNYAASGKALDSGRTYAWQVVAKNNNQFVAQSEVWTFKIAAVIPIKKEQVAETYALIENDLKGIYLVKKQALGVKYYSYNRQYETTLLIVDENGQVLLQQQQVIKQGDNYFDVKIGKRFEAARVYQLSFSEPDGKKQLLRFSISKK